jgi:hypothetical protein
MLHVICMKPHSRRERRVMVGEPVHSEFGKGNKEYSSRDYVATSGF